MIPPSGQRPSRPPDNPSNSGSDHDTDLTPRTGARPAAAPDDGISPVEQKLLDELRHVRGTLLDADLADPQTWTRVGQVLQKIAADQRAQIARFAPGGDNKRTLN